ncbi:MAG: KamA family protein [Bacteroidales bacterium]|nr:KamA family protein [Bacteroidales bacterium]
MKKEILYFNIPQLLLLFKAELPDIVFLAETSEDTESFKNQLSLYISDLTLQKCTTQQYDAIKRIFKSLKYDKQTVHDLSTGNAIKCGITETLWAFLRGSKIKNVHPDFFIDLYFLFKQLEIDDVSVINQKMLSQFMDCWKSGLDEDIIKIREQNKHRIINSLIDKIEHSKNTSKYQLDSSLSYDEKYKQIKEWWNTPHFHLCMAIRDPHELNLFLGDTLSESTMALLEKASKKKMPFFITPYYLSLLSTGSNGYDDSTIRSYVLYSEELINTYGNIRAWEKEDLLETGKPNAAGWLLPEGNNIHRRYPEVAILIPDSMGRACGGLCAPCQRMYDFQNKRLNFNFESLKPKESWEAKLARLLTYYEKDSQLRDILITGGDALMSQNSTLRKILASVYKMALRKKEANKWRADGEKYAEIQRIRLGSRLLAYLPLRINDELIDILKRFKEKASAIGVKQFIIQTHFESPLEITPDAVRAIQAILSAGWLITNQLVFTAAASRRGHTAKLRQALNKVGVVCYYTFTVKGFDENYAMFAPNSRSLQEKKEEKSFGLMNPAQERQLLSALYSPQDFTDFISRFLKKNKLPFLSTDRNVLNLPAIGKSMTFSTIGITPSGERILKFKHDKGRKHSPIIHNMEDVFIVENKSIAAYLRQLEKMGENINLYDSIWSYSEGETEPLFKIYEYPDSGFSITSQYTNLHIDEHSDIAI